jgi:hypothetical protein
LSGLATSSTGFSYKVLGRGDGLKDYNSSGILTEITAPDTFRGDNDHDGFVRIASTPNLRFYRGASEAWMEDAEEEAHSVRGDLGTVIAPDVSIVLYGKLDSLSVDQIVPAGIAGSESGPIATGIWVGKYLHQWPNGDISGWYASEVHIFDNPQLRGHVSAGTAKLFWDC